MFLQMPLDLFKFVDASLVCVNYKKQVILQDQSSDIFCTSHFRCQLFENIQKGSLLFVLSEVVLCLSHKPYGFISSLITIICTHDGRFRRHVQ